MDFAGSGGASDGGREGAPPVLYAWFMISHTIEYLTKGRWHTGMRYTDKYLYVGLGMIVVQWVLKNVIKLVWGVGIG